MEKVLDVYRRPYDAAFPVVCMDETPRQLISETREPVPAAAGRPAREDYEYRRRGSCNVFMATEPLAGRRMTKVTARRTKTDWAHFLNDIAERHPGANQPCASLPLHLLVQRERVRHVAYQIVTVVGAHRSSGIPPRSRAAPALAHGARPAEYVSNDVCRGGTGRFPHGGPSARARARRRAGRYRLEASGMTALSRMTARLSALRAASGLGRRSIAASCS